MANNSWGFEMYAKKGTYCSEKKIYIARQGTKVKLLICSTLFALLPDIQWQCFRNWTLHPYCA
jgi:hypothetical protein